MASAFFSCSNNNTTTTYLVNEKKSLEDSIAETKNKEDYYTRKSKEEIKSEADSLKWQTSADSAGQYYRKGQDLKAKLKAVNFSLDSISRMK
jgi:hypothetical protein